MSEAPALPGGPGRPDAAPALPPVAAPLQPASAVSMEPAQVDPALAEPAPVETTQSWSGLQLAAGLLSLLALVAALYLARGFFVPLLFGILASYALHPLVDRLELLRLPRSIGAAVVLGALVGSFGWLGAAMSDDASALVEKLPEAARKLRHELSTSRGGAPSALKNFQDVAHELQGAAADAGATAVGANPAVATRPKPPAAPPPAPEPTWLRDYTLAQSALLASVLAQTPVVLMLTYFLLASGAHFRRKLVQLVGRSLSRKKDAVRMLDEIDTQVQRYLLTVIASNVLVALGTWMVFRWLGLEEAGVWGIAAGVLHFIPYLGPALLALGSGVAAFLQFGSLMYGLGVAALSMMVSGVIGMAFMTWLQSRFARVNAAVLFIALLFFGWLWGAWGLLLGAPLVAIAKVVFDRVDALNPLGDLLGH